MHKNIITEQYLRFGINFMVLTNNERYVNACDRTRTIKYTGDRDRRRTAIKSIKIT